MRRKVASDGPVLLLGGGSGEATCGILYLASFLRRNGIEAYVRLNDAATTEAELTRSLKRLMEHLRPSVVGLSLKWFHHVARTLFIARTLKRIDPAVRIVLGGNSASYWWKELLGWDCVDDVILGDGEVPLLALCRGEPSPPNVVSRGADAELKPALQYIQGASNGDAIHYSHLPELFLSRLDLASFSGWVAPGKGCGENCLYCGGTRGMQKATFGRATPFLRPIESVQRDHREIAPHTWQLRYDFAGSTAAFLEKSWEGVDLSRHSATYFLWGVPPPELAATLSRHLERVYMVLDIGCFSELQRVEQMRRGLLKPCPTDRQLLQVIEACQRHPNLELEISGIAGLPFANDQTLAQERKLVERVLDLGCTVGYQRLQSQPGALVTEHPERFEMISEARGFDDFLEFFSGRELDDTALPMIRFADPKLEAAVQRTSEEVDALVWERAERRNHVDLRGDTRLRNAAAARFEVELGDWYGRFQVPASAAKEKLTVVRAVDGAGLTCAPTLSPKRFSDQALFQGETGSAILAVLDAFKRPTAVDGAITKLRSQRVDPELTREIVEQLVAGKFLRPG